MASASQRFTVSIAEISVMKARPVVSHPGRFSFQNLALYAAIVLAFFVLGWMLFFGNRGFNDDNGLKAPAASSLRLEDIPFNGARAYEYLKKLCAIGPRPSGSSGMEAQQKLLAEHFKKLGGEVVFQRFRTPSPLDGSPVDMANIIVHWRPEKNQRILLCAHYDTLPYPLEDADDPRGTFLGANDNAGGVALLMELGYDMAKIDGKFGVDFLFLDGEEFMFQRNGRFFLGSEFFARDYANKPPKYRYRYGVLLDMMSDKDLQIYQERNSLGWKDSRPIVEALWSTAQRLGVREFIPQAKFEVQDDHVMLHNIGKIPCIDIIDFDYPFWHTQDDTPDKCSALSLAKAGWVISEWLKNAK
jgi:glutaminyl-peptide cyclotransferase